MDSTVIFLAMITTFKLYTEEVVSLRALQQNIICVKTETRKLVVE